MDDVLKSFLEKFAELERRVRKLAAEDRALRDEAARLRQRLAQSESEAAGLKAELSRRELSQAEARQRLNFLIERLNRMQAEGGETSEVLEAVSSEL